MASIKQMMTQMGTMYSIILIIVILIGLYCLYCYLACKGSGMMDKMTGGFGSTNTNFGEYNTTNPSGQLLGQNGQYASVNEIQTTDGVVKTTNMQNPADLLPKDMNSQWGQLNPSGQGELSNINLLPATYTVGINTVGQIRRNGNQQIRSEPPNPQYSVGPWNQSTIAPDFGRPTLEIGQGSK